VLGQGPHSDPLMQEFLYAACSLGHPGSSMEHLGASCPVFIDLQKTLEDASIPTGV